MIAVIELKNRLAAIKLTARQDASLFELRQHAINRRKPDLDILTNQDTIDVLGAQVTLTRLMKYIHNFQAWKSGLQANVFQAALVVFSLQVIPLVLCATPVQLEQNSSIQDFSR